MAAGRARQARIVCFGEPLLRLSPPGRELLLQSPRLAVHFGGAEANVAVSLAILGQRSAMVATLPDNALGRACLGELRGHGVDTGGLRFGSGRMGLYLLAPGASGRAAEVLYDRAASAFAGAGEEAYHWPALLEGADWLHLSGINLALGERSATAALAAVRAAAAAGVPVSFDCNHRASLWAARAGDAPRLLQAAAGHAELLFANERDIALILGASFDQALPEERFAAAAAAAFAAWPGLRRMASTARRQPEAGPRRIRGMLAHGPELHLTPEFALDDVVDRIGAGDAFAAGLLHGLSRGWADAEALAFATAAACLKHSVPGDANLLDERAIQEFARGDPGEVRR